MTKLIIIHSINVKIDASTRRVRIKATQSRYIVFLF